MVRMHTKYVVGIVSFGILAVAGIVLFLKADSGTTEVIKMPPVVEGTVLTLTSDGFVPAELRVKVGERITFVTTTGKPFWPASDPHPSHTFHPELDPEKPVPPETSWSFTTTKPGTWRYHDHLAPYYTGTLIVE